MIVICLDGCGPEYLACADTPTLDALAQAGTYCQVRAMVPTVTNVNNSSIITAAYPRKHGITGNYFRDEMGNHQFMESADLILCPTIFDLLRQQGRSSALLTVKDKLCTLIGVGATISISAEQPPTWLVSKLGPPPPIYSTEVNYWLMLALHELLRSENRFDFIYLATSDYPLHKYRPEDEKAQYYLWKFDKLLGNVICETHDLEVVVTADHGMNAKTRAIDPAKVLQQQGIHAEVVPVIKDRYVAHHSNLGGAAYLYLDQLKLADEAIDVLQMRCGVEAVLTREEAVSLYHLHPNRIGDLFLLAAADTVFGNLEMAEVDVAVRSHGSLHEQMVPLIAWGQRATRSIFVENKDAAKWIPEPG